MRKANFIKQAYKLI